MKLKTLYEKLAEEIKAGHGDCEALFNCEFIIPYNCNSGEILQLYLSKIKDVKYEYGDINFELSYK